MNSLEKASGEYAENRTQSRQNINALSIMKTLIPFTLQHLKFFLTAVLLVVLSFSTVSAQVRMPEIKNASNGKPISLMKTVPGSTKKADKAKPVATKTFALPGGGTRTVKLLKGADATAFAPTAAAPTSSTSPTQICTSTKVNGERGGIDASNLNPATQAIFPGSIIDGMTVPTGEYRQITAARNPIVISLSSSANGVSAAESVDQPNVATIRTAVDKMLGAKAGIKFTPEAREDKAQVVRSQEEVMLALNLHASNLQGSFDFTGKFTEESNQITFMRVLKDRYFSVDVVPPVNDVDFFQSAATTISPDWTYVSSMKYGRIGVLVIVVRTKEREITAELKAKYQAGFSASGSFNAELKSKTESVEILFRNQGGAATNISAGSPDGVVAAMKKFDDWVTDGATSPVPLAYTLNFVKYENGGPAVASINSALSFTERKCRAVLPRYKVTLKEIKCVKVSDGSTGGDEEEIYGTLSVKAFDGDKKPIPEKFGKNAVCWTESESGHISLKTGKSKAIGEVRFFDVPLSDADACINLGGDLDEDDAFDNDELDDDNGARTNQDIFLRTITTTPKIVIFNHKSGATHIQQIWEVVRTSGN